MIGDAEAMLVVKLSVPDSGCWSPDRPLNVFPASVTKPRTDTRASVPERGDVWLELPARGLIGHEPQVQRPVVIVSGAGINAGPWPLVVVASLTTRDRGIPLPSPAGDFDLVAVGIVEVEGVDGHQRVLACPQR